MGVQYDAAVIEKACEQLYRQASSLELAYTLLGSLIGVSAGFMLGDDFISPGVLVPMLFFLGALIGFSMGRSRALLLRLKAQSMLCQVQIEANTRGLAAGARAPLNRAI